MQSWTARLEARRRRTQIAFWLALVLVTLVAKIAADASLPWSLMAGSLVSVAALALIASRPRALWLLDRARDARAREREALLFDAAFAAPRSSESALALDLLVTQLWKRGALRECIEVVRLRPPAMRSEKRPWADREALANALSIQALCYALVGENTSAERARDELQELDVFSPFRARIDIAMAIGLWRSNLRESARERIEESSLAIALLPERERALARVLAGKSDTQHAGSYRSANSAMPSDEVRAWLSEVAPMLREELASMPSAASAPSVERDASANEPPSAQRLPRPRTHVRAQGSLRTLGVGIALLVGAPWLEAERALPRSLTVVLVLTGLVLIIEAVFRAALHSPSAQHAAIAGCEREWSRGARETLREYLLPLTRSTTRAVAMLACVRMSQLSILRGGDEAAREALAWAEDAMARAEVRRSLNDRPTIAAVHAWVVALALLGREQDALRAARWLEDEDESRAATVLATMYSALHRDRAKARAIAEGSRGITLPPEHDLVREALRAQDSADELRVRERARAWKAGAAWLRATTGDDALEPGDPR
ncbi:MAG: hypothetical protein U0269_08270 [Polyangiales bacterium]